MRILLLSSSFNSLTQQAYVLLKGRHHVGVAAATTAEVMRDAVGQFEPDLILCPMLAHVIPRDIWENIPCLIVHPGIVGDRGPNSLDWAILKDEKQWGVTIVQAAEHVDSGPIWAAYVTGMREGSKSSLYRDEITEAALNAMMVAVQRFEGGLFVPKALDYSRPDVKGIFRPSVKQAQRRIDWQNDPVAAILRKIRSADSNPGLLDEIRGQPIYLYGAHEEGSLVGNPGDILAQRNGAICRATVDGAVWITHGKLKGGPERTRFKLPAAQALGGLVDDVPELPIAIDFAAPYKTYRDIWYEERNGVGYVNFDFYNGAMGTEHCQRLTEAVMYARGRPTKVIVLRGGRDFWSNGIHLNLIEAAEDPAEESWRNINAIDDLVLAILTATNHLTVGAMYGSAGAGGVMLALAADRVLARDRIVLNPHYKGMGGLYGSEYWTYTLPKRVGAQNARQLTDQCLPISIREAKSMGMIDDIVITDDLGAGNYSRFGDRFGDQIVRMAERLAHDSQYDAWLDRKLTIRAVDEQRKPLVEYRHEELEEMSKNFWGEDRGYHIARSAFVRKQPSQGMVRCAMAAMASPRPDREPTDAAALKGSQTCIFPRRFWSVKG